LNRKDLIMMTKMDRDFQLDEHVDEAVVLHLVEGLFYVQQNCGGVFASVHVESDAIHDTE